MMSFVRRVVARLGRTARQVTRRYPYRSYFRRRRALFLHVPRTGGTSVLAALSGGGRTYRDHLPWHVYRAANPVAFRKYFKFAVVRDPYTRALSTYRYLMRGGNQHGDLYFQRLFEERGLDFRGFVLQYLDYDTMFSHLLFYPQTSLLCSFDDAIVVDRLVRFESLADEMPEVLRSIGVTAPLPHLNRSEPLPCEDLEADVRRRIEQLYARDFRLLGYELRR